MGRRFLVTAGNTREMIDRVRDWGNIFTGNTGFAIARELCAFGKVELLTSNAQHIEASAPLGIAASGFRSHADLMADLQQRVATNAYDAIYMTAAVADYAPVRTFAVLDREALADGTERWVVRDVQAGKVKSHHRAIAVLGEQTPKIIDCFRRDWGYGGLLVKFKLEVGLAEAELLAVGRASREASGADYLVANTLDMVGGERPGAWLISGSGAEWIDRAELARRCARLVHTSGPAGAVGGNFGPGT